MKASEMGRREETEEKASPQEPAKESSQQDTRQD